jgi:riboflavin kinase/FMN adenylyltransferase
MRVVRGHANLASLPRQAAVAIGNFDGVHVGHQRIFAITCEKARAKGGEACVLTFDPHPAKVLAAELAPPLILPLERRLELVAEQGIDLVLVEKFDRTFAAQPADAFVDEILVMALRAKEIVVGEDFTYGRGRAGNVETLAAAGRARGFGVTVVEKVTVGGLVASSSKIRELVLEGRVEGAAQLLGRPFELSGEVVRGAGRGRTIGVPTANLKTTGELTPKLGVYAGRLFSAGKAWDAVVNIGVNPTFTAGDTVSVESHMLDFNGDLYGASVRLELTFRVRAEQRFPNAESLVAQIKQDIASARRLLSTPPGKRAKGDAHGGG